MRLTLFVIPILFLAQTSCATTPESIGQPCVDPKVQSQRSEELQKIGLADQADRQWQIKGDQPTKKILEKMPQNDLKRRKRVGEILGEGCIKSAMDYENAFIVYQHGTTSDQYLQAFLWSKRALELGDDHVKGDVAMAVDRYLVSVGHKELFGTQATQSTLGGCWCIQPVEETFPEDLRNKYRGGPNAAYTGLKYLKILNKDTTCTSSYCDKNLLPSPQGTVPGFW